MPDSPLAIVEKLTDQRIALRLKDDRQIEGKLLGLDEHLNIVLDDANETAADATRHLGRLVVRGSNVVALFAPNASRPRSR